jgi:hypothetical protein
MTEYDISPKELLAFGLSTLINIMISAFGAPIGPVIAALLIKAVIGGYVIYRYDRGGD